MNFQFSISIPKGLTEAQRNLFLKMSKEKYSLYTTEGASYRCWLKKDNSTEKIPVDRRTANSLASKNVIVPDHSHEGAFFKWKLK